MDNLSSSDRMVVAAGMVTVCSLAIGVKLIKKKLDRKRRSSWARPLREKRQRRGNIQSLFNEFNLSTDLNGCKSYILMDELCFEELLSYIEEDIIRQDTSMRICVPVEQRVASTLRFLATGESFTDLNKNTNLSPSFLSKNIIEVCEAIYKNMKDKYLKFPDSKEKWLEIAEGFESRWQFPHCIGALDAKHIAFSPTKEEVALFHNNKGFSSIVLLVMCDANYKFTFVDIGCNGRISDGDVLRRSDLMVVLNRAERVFPKPDFIGNNRKVPYVILANNAFPNTPNLITPYFGDTTQKDMIIFNARLGKACQSIERAFEVLADRFQVLQTKIKLNVKKTVKIVQCCCVLHNFLIEKSPSYRQNLNDITISDGLNFENSEEKNANDESQTTTDIEIESIRKTFANYFSNEGNL